MEQFNPELIQTVKKILEIFQNKKTSRTLSYTPNYLSCYLKDKMFLGYKRKDGSFREVLLSSKNIRNLEFLEREVTKPIILILDNIQFNIEIKGEYLIINIR